jgi:hypothetical protein
LLEMGGMVGGSVVGSGLGPAGIVGGAGLGYGIGKEATRLADIALGNVPVQPLTQTLPQAAQNVLEGATMEAGGRVLAPVLSSVFSGGRQAINRLRDPKSAAYIAAVEGKGRDIVNALRSPKAVIVPGSTPTPGEIAAPIGSA